MESTVQLISRVIVPSQCVQILLLLCMLNELATFRLQPTPAHDWSVYHLIIFSYFSSPFHIIHTRRDFFQGHRDSGWEHSRFIQINLWSRRHLRRLHLLRIPPRRCFQFQSSRRIYVPIRLVLAIPRGPCQHFGRISRPQTRWRHGRSDRKSVV